MARKVNVLSMATGASPSSYISVRWLARELRENRRLRLLDVSIASNDSAATGYLPRAVRVDFEALSAACRAGIPDPLFLAALMSQAGVGDEDTIIVYDDGHGTRAALLLSWLRRYGHDAAYCLLGGKSEWLLRGMKLASEADNPRPSSYTVKISGFTPDEVGTGKRARQPNGRRTEKSRAA